MNSQFLKENWSTIRNILKQKYPDLTNNDLAYVAGREDDVFSWVEIRTGAKREELEDILQNQIKAA